MKTLSSSPSNNLDSEMGAQLSAQWEIVKGGMKQQLIFGAMMLKVREHVTVSARGHGGKFGNKGDGLKGWMAAHAPMVGRQSAYRMMEVAEGIREDFKIGKRVDLEELLATALENLPKKLAEKRAQIEEVIEGKSQRQLLLEFGRAEPKSRGGHHPRTSAEEPLTREELAERSAQDLFHALSLALFQGNSEGEKQKLFLLPITSNKPGDITGLADLYDHAAAFCATVKAALEEKKAVVSKGR